MIKQTTVGIADMKIIRSEGVVITYALGSCIGICLYDPMIKLAGMVHIMLPQNTNHDSNLAKYADAGVPELLRKMAMFGGSPRRIVAKIAGGARMFEVQGSGMLGNIGQRNIEAVKVVLRKEGIRLLKEDTGANYARTLSLHAANGEVYVRSFGREELKL